jgi:HEAT repeat protein
LLAGPEATDRVAAAEGLLGAIRVASQITLRGPAANAVELSRSDLVQVAGCVVPAVVRGLRDDQPAVRRSCIQAVSLAATSLGKLVADLRPPNAADELEDYRRAVEKDLRIVQPLARVLREQTPPLTRALVDGDGEVRLLARQALEALDVAEGRVAELQRLAVDAGARLQQRGVVPGIPVRTSGASMTAEPAALSGDTKVAALVAGLKDKDVRARRAALDGLETLGPTARPAAPALVAALGDPDRFVRWAAARVLGKLGPAEVLTSVPALAKLLEDNDLNVQVAATTALERFGPPAAPAVPALVRAIGTGDVELRVVAMRALQRIGGDAGPVLPILVRALEDPDVRMRKMAAQTIGAYGASARAAVNSLRGRLNDEDAEVRRAASTALLALTQAPER